MSGVRYIRNGGKKAAFSMLIAKFCVESGPGCTKGEGEQANQLQEPQHSICKALVGSPVSLGQNMPLLRTGMSRG